MSRRDTILIAVLVNAVLLIGLFISAIKSDVSQNTEVLNAPKVLNNNTLGLPLLKEENKVAKGDEIDQVLKEFTEKAQNSVLFDLTEKKPISSLENKVQEESMQSPMDFVKDLQALTQKKVESKIPLETKGSSVKPLEKGIIEVVVKRGDALEKIARNHETTVDEIIRLNQLKNTQLQIGQVLKIHSKTPSKQTKEEKQIMQRGEEYYIVKSGDSLWTIALKNHVRVEELLKLNHLDEEKAKQLKPNTKLRIR